MLHPPRSEVGDTDTYLWIGNIANLHLNFTVNRSIEYMRRVCFSSIQSSLCEQVVLLGPDKSIKPYENYCRWRQYVQKIPRIRIVSVFAEDDRHVSSLIVHLRHNNDNIRSICCMLAKKSSIDHCSQGAFVLCVDVIFKNTKELAYLAKRDDCLSRWPASQH